jgi:hypothetical protein
MEKDDDKGLMGKLLNNVKIKRSPVWARWANPAAACAAPGLK